MTAAPPATFPLVSGVVIVGLVLLLSWLRQIGKVPMRFVVGAVVAVAVVGFVALGIHFFPETPAFGVVFALSIGLLPVVLAGVGYYAIIRLSTHKSPLALWREEDEALRQRAAERKQLT